MAIPFFAFGLATFPVILYQGWQDGIADLMLGTAFWVFWLYFAGQLAIVGEAPTWVRKLDRWRQKQWRKLSMIWPQ